MEKDFDWVFHNFIEEELKKLNIKDLRTLFLKMWSECKESPEYDKEKWKLLQMVLEKKRII